jgi:hypothetical protein
MSGERQRKKKPRGMSEMEARANEEKFSINLMEHHHFGISLLLYPSTSFSRGP